ncbi:MAG TPA: kelch repeat-containing protein [Chthoniobacterales bacterium]|jgi:hypothetical protein|nr:kelch repeat-containing protein [Chthoniobacterales bacterium]
MKNYFPSLPVVFVIRQAKRIDLLLLFAGLSLCPIQLIRADPAGTLINPRVFHTATRLLDGRVLLAGGLVKRDGGGFEFTDSCEIYDPATNSWSATGSLNEAREFHHAVLLSDGRVLVASGLGPPTNGLMKTVEIYDPTSGTWSFTKAMLNPPGGNLVLLADGRVLAPGGEKQMATSCELYDPGTATWALTGGLNIGRNGLQATRLGDGRVLTVGGVEPMTPGYVRQCELYDPVTGTWSLTGTLNQTHAYGEQVLLADGRVLLAGGRVGKNNPSRITEIFDPNTGVWTVGRPLTTQRVNFTANLLDNGNVFAAGGSSDGPGNDVLTSIEEFEAATGRWHLLTTTLAMPRQYHTATKLLDGRVLLAGGSSFGSTLFVPEAEVFATSP